MSSPTPDLLAAITASTRRRVEVARQADSARALDTRAARASPRGEAFRAAVSQLGRVNIVAECKRRSPSRGVLQADYDPAVIAASYERAGAVAVSVLTEPTFFDGTLEHLSDVRRATSLPLLRKDFILDEWQLVEARAHGADAVLLIVAALDEATLAHLHVRARALDLAVLVEVHHRQELQRALQAGAEIIGVNNRNLRTLQVEVRASEDIASRLPANVIAISESGLQSSVDLRALSALGYRAFLIGERFMTAADPGVALAQLLRDSGGGAAEFEGSSAGRLPSPVTREPS